MQGLRPEILAGIPDDMYYAVRRIEDSFVVGTPDLRRLTNHFEGELQKGTPRLHPHPIEDKLSKRVKAWTQRAATS